MNDLITTQQAAELIGLDPSQVRRLVRTGVLPSRRLSQRVVLIDRADAIRVRDCRPKVGRPQGA